LERVDVVLAGDARHGILPRRIAPYAATPAKKLARRAERSFTLAITATVVSVDANEDLALMALNGNAVNQQAPPDAAILGTRKAGVRFEERNCSAIASQRTKAECSRAVVYLPPRKCLLRNRAERFSHDPSEPTGSPPRWIGNSV
jgi:hypothetical protein